MKFDDNEWYVFKKDNINDLDEESYPYKLFKDFKFNLTPEKIEYDVTLNSHDKITVKRINYGNNKNWSMWMGKCCYGTI